MKNTFLVAIVAFFLASCATILPHSSSTISSEPITLPVYTGKDTATFAVGGGASIFYIPNTNNFYNPNAQGLLDAQLYSGYAEGSYGASNKWYNYGFAVFGYGGAHFSKEMDTDISHTLSFGGFGGKASIGVTANWNKVAWHIINLQSSFAYDLGNYPNMRGRQYALLDAADLDRVVPSNVVSNAIFVSSKLDFEVAKQVRLGFYGGLVFDGYINSKGRTQYAEGLRGGTEFRTRHAYIRMSGCFFSYSPLAGFQLGAGYIF